MKVKTGAIFNAKAVIADAEAGRLSLDEVRKAIRKAENFNIRDAVAQQRAIEQRMLGENATRRLSNTHAPGTAAWAYAEFGAVPKAPYSWAALDPQCAC